MTVAGISEFEGSWTKIVLKISKLPTELRSDGD